MADECAVCRKRIGTLFAWRWKCDACNEIVCGEHHKSDLCTPCLDKVQAVVVLERDDEDVLQQGTTRGIVMSEDCATLSDALLSLKKNAFRLDADVVLGAKLMHSKSTYPAAKNMDELKSGRWTGSGTSTHYQYRGEAVRTRS